MPTATTGKAAIRKTTKTWTLRRGAREAMNPPLRARHKWGAKARAADTRSCKEYTCLTWQAIQPDRHRRRAQERCSSPTSFALIGRLWESRCLPYARLHREDAQGLRHDG